MTTTGDDVTPPTARLDEPLPVPEPVRPETRLPPGPWVRANLFRTPVDGVITVIVGAVLAYATYRFGRLVLVTGQWEIVERNLLLFLVGRFDRAALWRPAAALAIGAFAAGLLAGIMAPPTGRPPGAVARSVANRTWPLALLVVVLLMLAGTAGPALLVAAGVGLIMAGRILGRRLPAGARRPATVAVVVAPIAMVVVISGFGGVPWDAWGGLLLNVFLALCGIGLSFPFGVLLALGRRSTLPVARWLSIAYIELFRGIPLVALILMGVLTVQFLVPPAMTPGQLVRIIIVFTVFTAAYVAEIVRGGLQSIPRGQTEAATAMGMSPARITALIVMPQALRASIPALVGQFISLFKDTSLVYVVGITEVLRVSTIVTQQGDFRGQGLLTETLIFAMFIFWVGSFTMSRESQRLERRFGVGER
jgi:general L-amino acid transport system permease protein